MDVRKKVVIVICLMLAVVLILLLVVRQDKNIQTTWVDNSKQEETAVFALRLSFLDVGQGDATLVDFADGRQMLVDCAKDAGVLEALGRVVPFYDHYLDYLVVTHPDLDHYGGCIDVLERFEVGTIIYNGLKKSQDKTWQEFWQSVQAEGAEYFEVNKPAVWEVASTTIRFLYPDHAISDNPFVPGGKTKSSDNNTSIVLKISFGEVNFLLTGDAESELEEYLQAIYGRELDVEVLKVGHHGSGSSSGQEFLDLVTPYFAIISAGANNRYGHPSPRVLKRLDRVGGETLRTDTQGDIILTVDNEGNISVN